MTLGHNDFPHVIYKGVQDTGRNYTALAPLAARPGSISSYSQPTR